jgi:hypothetical protein
VSSSRTDRGDTRQPAFGSLGASSAHTEFYIKPLRFYVNTRFVLFSARSQGVVVVGGQQLTIVNRPWSIDLGPGRRLDGQEAIMQADRRRYPKPSSESMTYRISFGVRHNVTEITQLKGHFQPDLTWGVVSDMGYGPFVKRTRREWGFVVKNRHS